MELYRWLTIGSLLVSANLLICSTHPRLSKRFKFAVGGLLACMALAILLTDWGAATGKQIDPSLTLVTTSTSLPFFESLMKPPPPPFEPRRARVTVKHPRSYWGTGAGAQGRSSIGDKAGCPRGKRCKIVAWGAGVRVQGELTGDVAYVTATSADSFAAVRVDGTVQSWSHSRATATYPLGQVLAPPAVQRVLTIATTDDAFAVIMAPGGSVIAWGHQDYGGSNVPEELKASDAGVVELHATRAAFAAVLKDGRVVCWGRETAGGGSVPSQLSSGKVSIIRITSSDEAFAAVLADGSVAAWGSTPNYMGSGSVAVTVPAELAKPGAGAVSIASTSNWFTVLRNDGTVAEFGDDTPANSGKIAGLPRRGLDQSLQVRGADVVSIATTLTAFAATLKNGTIMAWGSGESGKPGVLPFTCKRPGLMESTVDAFAVLCGDGTVRAWGNSQMGGDVPGEIGGSNSVQLQPKQPRPPRVVSLASTDSAFAALRDDGSVISWGDPVNGGIAPQSIISKGADIAFVASTAFSFAAVNKVGSVVSWGDQFAGGAGAPEIVASPKGHVVSLASSSNAFCALVEINENETVSALKLSTATSSLTLENEERSGMVRSQSRDAWKKQRSHGRFMCIGGVLILCGSYWLSTRWGTGLQVSSPILRQIGRDSPV